MKPLELDVNFTPNSTGRISFVSVVPGLAVLGQIVAAIAMLSVALAICTGLLESVTCTVKLVVPELVGVPDINPPVESINPAGRLEPETNVQLKGCVPPVAARVWS